MNTRNARSSKAEINVTPLIDVVLVVLIIFMIATPTVLRQLAASVPKKSSGIADVFEEPLVVSYRSGVIMLNKQPTTESKLTDDLRSRLAHRRDKVVFFDIDDDASYGVAVRLMDLVRGVGAKTLALETR